MAKRIVDEEMRFKIIVNGDEAQKELYELEKVTRDLTQENKDLRAEKSKLRAEGKQNTQQYKNLTAVMKKNTAEIKEKKNRMEALQDEIGLTGLSMAQLGKRASKLRLQLHNMVPGSAEFDELQEELRETDARMRELRTGSRAASSGVGGMADKFNRFATMGAVAVATITGFVFSIQQMIDYNGKLADAMSNVRKTTGMTKLEVDELAKSFGMLKTRTARIDLLKIAEEGGRVGIAKEEIGEFVEVMNQAAVALGDSFLGGVEEVSAKLGKLKGLFQETKEMGVEEAYMDIGSAINDLGANGVATEANIAEFATRVGSLPAALKPSISEALALGAAFEESGIMAERAGRGYNILIAGAAENAAKFANVMNLTTKQVEDMINTSPLEFMIQFAKGMKGMNATDTANTLKYLGVSANVTTKMIGALADKSDLFRDSMVLSNKSMALGTSLTEEYNIKNNNLAATISKVGKSIKGAFSSETVINFLNSSITWFAKFIGATEDTTGGVTRFKAALVFLLKLLTVVGVAMLTNVSYLKLSALWTGKAYEKTILYTAAKKAQVIATELAYAASQLYAAATMLLTGNIKGATQAIRVMSATMKTTPWGLVLGLIATLTTAYFLFREETKKAATVQSMLSDAIADAQEKTAGQISKLQALQEVVEDETASQEARKEAIKAINQIVPGYNKNLDLSTEALKKGKTAIDNYVESLQKQAEAQFLADQVAIKSKELMKQQNSSISKHVTWYESLWNSVKSLGSAYQYANYQIKTGLNNRREKIALIKEELAAAKEAYKSYIKLNPDTTVTEDEFVSNFNVPTTDDPKGAAQKQRSDDLLQLYRETEDAKNALIQDAFEREMAQADANHRRKIQDLRSKKIKEAEIAAISTKIDTAIAGGDSKTASSLIARRRKMLQKNDQINEQIQLQEKAHQAIMGKIIVDGFNDDLASLQEQFAREKTIRETSQNEQLANFIGTEAEKKVLKEKFAQQNLEAEAQHLQELKAMAKEVLSSGEFEGFDLDLLTDEQVQAIKDKMAQVGLSISQVNALLRAMGNGGKGEGDMGGSEFGLAGDLDILGFSVDQWDRLFENLSTTEGKIKAAAAGVQAMINAWSMYNKFLTASENRQMREFNARINRKKQNQENLYNNGLISKRQYDNAIEAMNKEQASREAQLRYKQAKRNWKLSMAQAVGNTAIGVTKALASTAPPANFILAALVGALGAIQIATIAKNKPVKGYEKGLYPVEREQDGKMFNARWGGESRTGLVDAPTVFMAGEQGKSAPEMIISGTDYKGFSPDFRNSLHREIARVKGFENGMYPNNESTTMPGTDFLQALSNNTAVMSENRRIMEETMTVLKRLDENGVTAFMARNLENAKKMKEDITRYEKLRNKSKI